MKNLKRLAIGLLLAGAFTLPVLADQRGGASSGGWRPQSPSMESNCQTQPCGW